MRPAVRMALDPHSTSHALQSAHTALSHLLTSTSFDAVSHHLVGAASAATAAVSDGATAAADVAATSTAAVGAATDAAAETAKTGVWKSFVNTIELCITLLHNGLVKAGIPGAYGLSIMGFTVAVKALTFPLNFRQMESTMKMQALSPKVKKVQADYKDNPAVLNQMIADIYKKENVNPLAGCFPVFAQIPVWIALYRSVLNLASENLLDEPFLWLPSLQGPVSKTGQGLDTWLYPLIDGAPPIGWHDAICYLVLPVALVATQFYSQKIMSPPSTDPKQNQANAIFKFMPLLIGWFSLNVPAGLGIYWVTNNLLSTAQTVYIRRQFPHLTARAAGSADDDDEDDAPGLAAADGFSSTSLPSAKSTTKAPKNKKRRKRR